MTKKATETPEATAPKSMFAVYEDVAKIVNTGVDRLELEDGATKFRVLEAPHLQFKHWALPESSELTVVPCAKFIPQKDLGKFLADPDAYLETLPACPYCELEEEFGNKALGKDKGFYNRRAHWTLNVAQAGKVKLAEFGQVSIMNGIMAMEKNPEWTPLFGDYGISDIELVVTKEIKNKKTNYAVGGSPLSKKLTKEEYEKFMSKLFDIPSLITPPDITTEEGREAFDDLLKKAGQPKKNERPKTAKSK